MYISVIYKHVICKMNYVFLSRVKKKILAKLVIPP